jgi:hypothetical protein
MQENPTLEPSLSIIHSVSNDTSNVTSKFVGLDKIGESTHLLKALERSIADFIPLLPPGSNIKVGIIDYIINNQALWEAHGILRWWWNMVS